MIRIKAFPFAMAAVVALCGACGDGDGDDNQVDGGVGGSGNGGGGSGGENNGGNESGGDAGPGSCAVTPGEWSSDDFEDDAEEALALRTAVAALASDLLNTAEQTTWGDSPMDAPSLEDIMDAYEAGSPSVADVTSPALDELMQQVFEDWTAAIDEDPASYEFMDADGPEWTASGDGGMHERPLGDDGSRRFRAYGSSGVELRQLVDKGLFVGSLYNYALGLTEGDITPATVHALAAAWGSNPSLDASPAEDAAQNDDTAAYSADMGLYDETAAALTAAQAYAADDDCTAERDEALVEFFRYWEQAAFARGTFYGGAPLRGRDALDAADPETVLGPLHEVSEGFGLMLGLRGMSEPAEGPLAGAARLSTDDDIDTALAALGVDVDDVSAGTTGEWLVESLTTYEDGLNGDFKDVVQDVFGWSDDQFDEYTTEPVPTQ